MARQELVAANKFNRKHDLTWWGQKERRSGTYRPLGIRGGGGSTITQKGDRMKANIDVPVTPGYKTVAVPTGGTAVIPIDTIIVPALNDMIDLSGIGPVVVVDQAIYYAALSVLLFVPGVNGPTRVTVDLYKNNTYYQQVIHDFTPNGLELEQRYHAGDYVELTEGDTLEWRFRGLATPVSYAIIDAYINVGYGPLR